MRHFSTSLIVCALFLARPAAAETQSVSLIPGWNQIGLQLTPGDSTVRAAFADLIASGSLSSVWTYDGPDDGWRSFRPDAPGFLNSLETVRGTAAYFVEITSPASLVIDGEPSGALGVNLVAGANLVSWGPLDVAIPIEEVLEGRPAITEVFSWDPGRRELQSYSGGRGALTAIEPGRGYWFVASQATYLPFNQDAPLLEISSTSLSFVDGQTRTLTLRNGGRGRLLWTVSSPATWLRSPGGGLARLPLSNLRRDDTGLAEGESVVVTLDADAAGYPPGAYEEALVVTSNGGVTEIEVALAVETPNLNGLWVGAFASDDESVVGYPGFALDVTQSGATVEARIDARLAPAFATSVRAQPHRVLFTRSEGSVAVGKLDVMSVPDTGTHESWTVTALDATRFSVAGSQSGEIGMARVGQIFGASGLELEVKASGDARTYQPGDTFTFEVAPLGFVAQPMTGSVTGSIAGEFPLDGAFLGIKNGVTRRIELTDLELESTGVLVSRFVMRHRNLLASREVVTEGTVKLVRER